MSNPQHLTPPCEFPVPNFDAPTASFGANNSAYLTREQLGEWYGCYGKNSKSPFHRAVEQIFYKGGKLEDYGLKWKDGIDGKKAMMAFQGLIGSFAPKHEIKIGTCAVALANWCDYASPIDSP